MPTIIDLGNVQLFQAMEHSLEAQGAALAPESTCLGQNAGALCFWYVRYVPDGEPISATAESLVEAIRKSGWTPHDPWQATRMILDSIGEFGWRDPPNPAGDLADKMFQLLGGVRVSDSDDRW